MMRGDFNEGIEDAGLNPAINPASPFTERISEIPEGNDLTR